MTESAIEKSYSSHLSWERFINLAIGIVYCLVFRAVYQSYISIEWGYTGLIYSNLGVGELFFVYGMVSLVSWMLPINIDRPSVVIVWFLFAIIFVPTMSITLMIGYLPTISYIPALSMLSLGMIFISFISKKNNNVYRAREFRATSHMAFFSVAFFVVTSLSIIYYYWDILHFANIDDIYVQRFAAADATSGVMGYIRSYNGYFFTPLVMAIGLCDKSKRVFVLLGLGGFILSYLVDASKISLVIPIAMIVSALLVRGTPIKFYYMTAGLAFVCLIAAALTSSVSFVRFLADLVLVRTIAIPAQTFAQYFDIFYFRGYTWWSNITGLGLIISAPSSFAHDPFWPVLGQIVGAEYYGFDSRVNINANPFVGEGVAAGGGIGLIVISLAIAGFLWLLDRWSEGWGLRVMFVLTVPIGFALTNIHLSTYLVSFGGFAWLALFRSAKPFSDAGSGAKNGESDRPGGFLPAASASKWTSSESAERSETAS